MFPEQFVWGVASSAHQVEGASEPEQRGESVWDAFSRTPGKTFDGHHALVACDQVGHLEEDLDLIAGLGARAYRFSIAWPRVMPEGRARVHPEGLAYYDRLVNGLLERGIEPWATLYHWDLPLDLHRAGGWLNRDIAGWFADYASVVVDRLSDRVRHWMTLNEPQVYLGHGFLDGVHAPGLRLSREEVLLATHHSLLAHGRGVQAIRARTRQPAVVGWAPVGETRYPASDRAEDIEAARASMMSVTGGPGWANNNTWYSDPVMLGRYPEDGLRAFGRDAPAFTESDMATIQQPIDFYGVNVYQGRPIESDGSGGWRDARRRTGYPHTQFHWPVTPDVLYWGPKFLYERYKLPIYVTENGLASMDWVHADGSVHDAGRIDFLTRYLSRVRDAIADGVDIRGYFQWSIMDNFEWGEGYRMRFGLVYVDFETLERIPKASYGWYRDLIASGGASLPASLAELR